MIIKITTGPADPDYYMKFNQATSFNVDTAEGANQVLIVTQGGAGGSALYSEFIVGLDALFPAACKHIDS